MNKEELLKELSAKVNSGEVSRAEIASLIGYSTNSTSAGPAMTEAGELKETSNFSINKILYILGAAIAIVGIFIFVAQVWEDLGSVGRIGITFGLGLLLAMVGSMLLKSKPEENIGAVFHFIAGLLIPGGALVTLSELKVETVSLWPVAITFGIIFIFYLLLNFVHKNAVLTFFAIANGTAFLYLLLQAIIGDSFTEFNVNIYSYLTMAIGVSYLLLAHSFRDSWNNKLIGMLYFFGSLGFLAAAFSQALDYTSWELLYFVLVFGGIALSTYMKSRIILVMSTLFLIAHVSYITDKYFADSLGWPLSLVLLGFIFIGLGYFSVNINKKYIAN